MQGRMFQAEVTGWAKGLGGKMLGVQGHEKSE